MKYIFCFLFTSWIFISSYAQIKFVETSHYLFPEFNQGVVLMKDGKRNNHLLNYNSLTEEMIFDKKGMKLAIGENEIRQVDTVFIKDRKFVALNNKIVELIYQLNWVLYVEHKCKLNEPGKPSGYGGTSTTTAIKTYSRFYSEGNIHELKLPDGYEIEPYTYYWLKKNGELYRFINMKELKKLYKDKKDLIKKYSKTNRVKYHDQDSIIQLIGFLESKRNSAS